MTAESQRRNCRPLIFEEPLTERFEIRLTKSQGRELAEVAKLFGKERSTLVREYVDECLGDFRERRMFLLTKNSYKPE